MKVAFSVDIMGSVMILSSGIATIVLDESQNNYELEGMASRLWGVTQLYKAGTCDTHDPPKLVRL